MDVRVQQKSFSAGDVLDAFTAAQEGAGAIVSFTGITRDISGGLTHMEIEHYPGMTERALTQISQEAADRWPLTGSLILHRYGRLAAAEPIMMVVTASAHRAAAFEAAEFLMDYLKSRAPFWKKEVTEGRESWVAAKNEDEAALARWSKP
ncbi:molybdenum cofactor biosynthesis protein MoaE [Aestuariibius insulae]|uniref:molybdenum cofactor biosynthesis protein MoaE n=1 Tax=Aestuariibius insulae TaxID=2058287 RepID=UPI00345EC911